MPNPAQPPPRLNSSRFRLRNLARSPGASPICDLPRWLASPSFCAINPPALKPAPPPPKTGPSASPLSMQGTTHSMPTLPNSAMAGLKEFLSPAAPNPASKPRSTSNPPLPRCLRQPPQLQSPLRQTPQRTLPPTPPHRRLLRNPSRLASPRNHSHRLRQRPRPSNRQSSLAHISTHPLRNSSRPLKTHS